MPAHLRPLDQVCFWSGCTTRATDALYNTYNRFLGYYCPRHGMTSLKIQQAVEAERQERKAHAPTR